MSPVSVFRLFLFSQLLLLLLLLSANGIHAYDECPNSFDCGNLGKIHFPFTKAERQDCGLLFIHGCECDDPNPFNKSIQLEKSGTQFLLTNLQQPENVITVFDQDLNNHLKSPVDICRAFDSNITLPQDSPLISFHMPFNVTILRCNYALNVIPPIRFIRHPCNDFMIYYYNFSYGFPNHDQLQNITTTFSSCSIVQLPVKDVPDTDQLISFLTGFISLQVRLSDACDSCYNQTGGHCQLGHNNSFFCDKVPTASPSERHKGKNMRARKLGIRIGLYIVILLVILITWQLIGRHCKRKYAFKNVQLQSIDLQSNGDPESVRDYYGVHLFSYEELKKATNSFDSSRELGNGGFGTVYYGKLEDGREVAVKRLYNNYYRRVEQFMNEIEMLTRLRHQNLVSLYGCTSRHSRELLLVYEYIPNGTVSCHLHGKLANPGFLPWHIRLKIAIETATALAYLHANDTIHRDVKTNNILLHNNFCVKVADFGLSRLFPDDVTHVSTAPQGSPGYVDPEYHQCYQLTSKSDVYSFGVVLVELISSKPAVDMSRQKDEINLANLAIKKIIKNEFGELVDASLGFESDSDVRRMIISVSELAFQCLQRDKDLRPSMDEVLKVLRRILECGKDEVEHVEEVGIQNIGPIVHSPSPDCDETGLLKKLNLKPLASPKAVTDKWHSSEPSTSNNASS